MAIALFANPQPALGGKMKKHFAVLGLVLVCLWGCSKSPVTVDDFKKTMEKAGYTIFEASGQFDRSIAESVTVARKEGYQIEFFLLTSEENAISSFNSNVDKLDKKQGDITVKTSTSVSNHSTYALRMNDRFYKVSRIGRTMIFLNVPQEQKNAVSDLLESMGY